MHRERGRTGVESCRKNRTFWKDADPDIPILKQAKAEYEKLK
jgi:hypothetical protein